MRNDRQIDPDSPDQSRGSPPLRNDISELSIPTIPIAALRRQLRQYAEGAPGGRYLCGGIRYGSLSEGACALLMERYIPGFHTEPLKSFQIPVLDSRTNALKAIDFRVGDTLIEFHPPRFWRRGNSFGDFASREDFSDYRRRFQASTSHTERRALRESVKEKLREDYTRARKSLIERSGMYPQSDLIVAASDRDFYRKVMLRFSPHPPSEEQFLREFRELQGKIRDWSSSPSRGRRRRTG